MPIARRGTNRLSFLPILWIGGIGLLGGCLHTRTTQKEQGTTAQQGGAQEKQAQSKQVAAPRPVGTTPESVFTSDGTLRLQRALARHGYRVSQSGTLDDETRRALERFQRANELASTGMPDYATCHALGLDPDEIFQTGSRHRDTDAAKRATTKRRAAAQKHGGSM